MLDGRLADRLAAEHGFSRPAVMVAATGSGSSAQATAEESEAVTVGDATANPARSEIESDRGMPAPADEDGSPGFDAGAESAFLAEARERGETISRAPAAVNGEAEENGGKPLPQLDELVNRIPENVRVALDDLFRARFVTVKRFPKKALK